MKYFNAAKKSMEILYNARYIYYLFAYQYKKHFVYDLLHRSPKLGLVGDCLNLNKRINNLNEFWCDDDSYIDGLIDSYYEYQLKCYKLFDDEDCLKWWLAANQSIMNYLSYYKQYPNDTNGLFNGTKLWFKRVNMYTGKDGDRTYQYDLYAAYFSGVLLLSGQLELAKINQEANWYMWNMYNIEPFLYDFVNDAIIQQNYWLNPENIESNYYLHMITNDTLYYNRALQYLNDIIQYDSCNDDDDSFSKCNGYAVL